MQESGLTQIIPWGLPWWLRWKSICLQCGRPGFHPWVRRIPWRRKWHPTPVLLPGEFHGWRSLVGYSPWSCKELDTTERLHLHFQLSRSNILRFSTSWAPLGLNTGMAGTWWLLDGRCSFPSWVSSGFTSSHWKATITDGCDISDGCDTLVYWYGRKYSISHMYIYVYIFLIFFILFKEAEYTHWNKCLIEMTSFN